MDEINNVSKEDKYRKTDIIDTTIVVLSAIASTLAFVFGHQLMSIIILAVSIGYFAKLIVLNSLLYAIIAAILGFGSSVLLSYFLYAGKTLFPSIIICSFIFTGVVFGLCVIFNKSKSFTCLCASIVFVIIFALAVVYELVMKTGSFNIANFAAYYDDLFVNTKSMLMEYLQPLSERFANLEIGAYVDSIIGIVKGILPGLIILLCEFVCMLSTTFFNLGIRTSCAFVVLPTEWKLSPHKIGGTLLLIVSGGTFIYTMFMSDGEFAFKVYTYLLNVIFVLAPQYILYGLSRMVLRKQGISLGSIFMILFLVFIGFVVSPIVLLLGLSSWGAILSIIVAKTEEQLKKDENRKEEYQNENDRKADEYFNSFAENKHNGYDNHYSDEYNDHYSDEYNDRYSDEYNDDYSDEENNHYSDEYNDDYSDEENNHYSDEYSDNYSDEDNENNTKKYSDDEDERRY